jgi:hypothetical protein
MARIGAVSIVVTLFIVVGAGGASASTQYAPIDRPGPPLTVDPGVLEASLACTGRLADAAVEPVLLVPATTVDSDQNFGFSYEPLLRAHGIPYCTSDLPGSNAFNMDPIQNRADFLVYAIRHMYGLANRRIAIVGASQGGMVERWPLRFWPDTRHMVADVVSLDGPNHGSLSANALCIPGCAPAIQQQTYHSHFIQAINSIQETFAGIDYSDIYTYTDDFVEPNLPGSSTVALAGPGTITNISIQQICPTMIAEHLMLAASNPVAAELTLDAITHPGPAVRTRIGRAVCAQLPFAMPGISTRTSATGLASAAAQVAHELLTYPKVTAEPTLPCYVFASCTLATRAPGTPRLPARSLAPQGSRADALATAFRESAASSASA